MERLWSLAGEIGNKYNENKDGRYAAIYDKLSEALDIAENTKLIWHDEEDI